MLHGKGGDMICLDTIKQKLQNKTVLITGHTGFKGTWLSRFLLQLGAKVVGIGLDEGSESLFTLTKTNQDMLSYIQDIRDYDTLVQIIKSENPDIVFHLAAQPLVLISYQSPVETFNTNVMGTIHLLEACRQLDSLQSIVLITTDKVYQNNEWVYSYRENDRLGGHDPYSASKAMCELAIESYRSSFYKKTGVILTAVRAGNVIGGGDFSKDRLIPDIIRSIKQKTVLSLRCPNSIRPWQYIMDALWGYLLICTASLQNTPPPYYHLFISLITIL